MKLTEIQDNYHVQVSAWISNAKRAAIHDIETILHDESTRDTKWFINKRGSRLKQLSDEIFTLKLVEVSKGKWSAADFEGQQHSDLITKALTAVLQQSSTIYRNIRTTILTKDVKKHEMSKSH